MEFAAGSNDKSNGLIRSYQKNIWLAFLTLVALVIGSFAFAEIMQAQELDNVIVRTRVRDSIKIMSISISSESILSFCR